jgi:hypothetical protein
MGGIIVKKLYKSRSNKILLSFYETPKSEAKNINHEGIN